MVARKLPVLALIAASAALGGCENQALLQWFDNKPKLQGNRVPVFPEGVPGVQQGVPPELLKGYQSQADQQSQAQAAAEAAQKSSEEQRNRSQAERPRPQQASQPAPQRVSQPRPQRAPAQPRAVQPQPEQTAAEPAPPPQRNTSAPLADRWPSAQQEPPPQQQQKEQPQQSATTRSWPGSEPSGPPTDRFR